MADEVKDKKPAYERVKRELSDAKKEFDAKVKPQASIRERLEQKRAERRMAQAAEDFKGETAKLASKVDDQKKFVGERFDRVERKLGRAIRGWVTRDQVLGGLQRSPTPGELFAKSDILRTARKAGKWATDEVLVKSFHEHQIKATPLASDATTRLVEPQRVPMVAPTLRTLRIRDLMPVGSTSSNMIEYIREVSFMSATRLTMTSITSVGTLATATTGAAHGLVTGDYVSIRGANQSEYNGEEWKVTVTGASTFTYVMLTDPAIDTATGTITWQKAKTQGAAAAVAEGSEKPAAEWVPLLVQAPVGTVAHYIIVTRQAVEDVAQLESYINNRLTYGLRYKEDRDLLYGTGVSPQIKGILTDPARQTYAQSAGPAGDTKGDAFRRAMTKSMLAEYEPTGGVLNPLDWEDIELAKDDNGQYMYIPIRENSTLGTTLWRIPVVVTNAIAELTGLVGGFQQGAQIWDREAASVRLFDQHSDLAIKNQLLLLAEERLALAIYRPEAFVQITFTA